MDSTSFRSLPRYDGMSGGIECDCGIDRLGRSIQSNPYSSVFFRTLSVGVQANDRIAVHLTILRILVLIAYLLIRIKAGNGFNQDTIAHDFGRELSVELSLSDCIGRSCEGNKSGSDAQLSGSDLQVFDSSGRVHTVEFPKFDIIKQEESTACVGSCVESNIIDSILVYCKGFGLGSVFVPPDCSRSDELSGHTVYIRRSSEIDGIFLRPVVGVTENVMAEHVFSAGFEIYGRSYQPVISVFSSANISGGFPRRSELPETGIEGHGLVVVYDSEDIVILLVIERELDRNLIRLADHHTRCLCRRTFDPVGDRSDKIAD